MAERILHLLEESSGRYVSRFPVRVGSRIQIVLADDIEWIAAAGDYVELHAGSRCHLVRETNTPWNKSSIPCSSCVSIAPASYV